MAFDGIRKFPDSVSYPAKVEFVSMSLKVNCSFTKRGVTAVRIEMNLYIKNIITPDPFDRWR
jgi:hypothetical protein